MKNYNHSPWCAYNYCLISSTASETSKVLLLNIEMEELRKAVIKLQENFKKVIVTEEGMKDVINCYTKNVEALKTYTLEINGRVGVIEETLKANKDSVDDIITEKVKRVREDLANLDDKIGTIGEKLLKILKMLQLELMKIYLIQ